MTEDSKSSGISNSRITLELGPETLATLARIVGSRPGATGIKGMLKEVGGMVARALAHYLTPHIIVGLASFGTMVALGWKAVMRGWFGL